MTTDDQPAANSSAGFTSFRVGLVVLAIIVLGRLVLRLEDTIGLVLLGATAAVVTSPLQHALRTRVGPGASYALTAAITFAVIVAAAAVFWYDLAQQAERLAALLTERIGGLSNGTLPQRLARLTRAEEGIDAVLEGLPSTLVAGRQSTVGVGTQAINLLVAIVLAAFLQAGGDAILDWAVAKWPRDDREQVRTLIGDMERRAGGLTRRSLALASAAAVAASLLAFALDVPGAVVLGCWAGAWMVVPTVGATVGLAPLVLAAWASSPQVGAAITVGAFVLTAAARSVRRAHIDSQVRLPCAAWILAIGTGTLIAGLGGVVVMVLTVAFVGARFTQPESFPRPVGPDDERAQLFEVRGSKIHMPMTWRSVSAVISGAMAVVVVAMALDSIARAIVWVVVAAMIAVALDRPASFIERRSRLHRRAAVGVVLSVGVVLIAAISVLGVLNAATTSSEFSSSLPDVVRDLESMPMVGEWLADRDAAVWVDSQLQDLPQRLAASGDIADYLPAVGSRVVDLMWTLLLAVGFLLDGPALAAAVRRRVPASKRRQAVRLSTVSLEAVSGYLGGAMVVAAINASVVLVVAIALGISLAPVLAAWAFIWNFVPQIGGFMGGFPLIVLALTAGPLQAVIAGVVYVSYQFIENHVIQPKIIGEAIDVPPWVTLLAALSGGAMAGLLGAVVLTPLVGVIHLAVRAARSDDFPGRVAETVGSVPIDLAAP